MAKTIFGVPAPAPVVSATPAATAKAAAPAADAAKAARTTGPHAPAARTQAAPAALSEGDRTAPTKGSKDSQEKSGETPVWTYVGVGFVFGLALLGVYRLVIVLAH